MGGAVSAGADNDELIDNLLEADYIKTAIVERVFRAVDRGHYFTVEYKDHAYRDIAWKYGNLHVSAPCIYSEVMESLKLGPGISFLNLGSGTGYLSTMAGLILGPYGINHGIEIHEDVINYAMKKLEEFISSASAIDEYEFCEPKFVCGNCLHFGSGARQYDRVYCSAACPENHVNYMKNLIKVGGILVIPVNDQLLQICRISDTKWEAKSVLPVSFAPLICGKTPDVNDPLKMPSTDPLSLQEICRFIVRSILRRNIDIEHPELQKSQRVPRKKVKKRTRQLVMPIFHSNSDDEDDFVTIPITRSIRRCSEIRRRSITRYPTFITTYMPVNLQNQTQRENAMDEDININGESGGSSDNIFDEMSESDFEELQNILAMSGTSARDSDEGKQKTPRQGPRPKNRNKEEKIDSGIVEDFEEADSDSDGDMEDKDMGSGDQYPFLKVTDSDTDTESCEDTVKKIERKKSTSPVLNAIPPEESPATACTPSPIDSTPNSEVPPPAHVLTYTTYMKEKINLLPLPMTLKYFLNLNREL